MKFRNSSSQKALSIRTNTSNNNNMSPLSPQSPKSASSRLPRSSTCLNRAIALGEWHRVLHVVTEFPEQAQKWSHTASVGGTFDGSVSGQWLPLHQALVLGQHSEPPAADKENKADALYLECLQALVRAYPDALLQAETSYDRLPLHCACRKHASRAIVQSLVQAQPDACLIPDALQRLPLHYALSNGADPDVIDLLMQTHPQAARGLDHYGFTPLHIACASGASLSVLESLVQAYPAAVWIASTSGFSVAQCIPQSPQSSRARHEMRRLVCQAKREHPMEQYWTQLMKQKPYQEWVADHAVLV
eukprot:CAMPEP_0172441756 /NCGR_PEP_ID=MMETSP1065-20121228/2255_1 /TAXON_ID=265537 /ORGANISM="Amphiprora paludosa, Strain CCMP125" /LENGTH=303 /DNA_ID=CAMNT_0013191265 /DNA_START=227 /DNA_END=1138 /DNA_ORIENTATION=-